MKVEQYSWEKNQGWSKGSEPGVNDKCGLVIFFTSRQILENENQVISSLHRFFPKAEIIGCSTAGEILNTFVTDDNLVLTAIEFEKGSSVKAVSHQIQETSKSKALGKEVIESIPRENLKHVFVLSDGLKVDGAGLVEGFREGFKNSNEVGITGGLAADADKFQQTRVYCNKLLDIGGIAAVGFYGDKLNSAYSALTGWKSYGPVRNVTKSDGTRLFELDGKPALQLYKEFLGPFAKELPGVGLLYPLRIWGQGIKEEANLARTILGVDEGTQSILCAGGIPQGCQVQFMMTNTNELVRAASESAENILPELQGIKPDLCLLMTCVSRKVIMKQRVEEEVEAVAKMIGPKTAYTGFYTYGEISPYKFQQSCELQNETMAVTALWES